MRHRPRSRAAIHISREWHVIIALQPCNFKSRLHKRLAAPWSRHARPAIARGGSDLRKPPSTDSPTRRPSSRSPARLLRKEDGFSSPETVQFVCCEHGSQGFCTLPGAARGSAGMQSASPLPGAHSNTALQVRPQHPTAEISAGNGLAHATPASRFLACRVFSALPERKRRLHRPHSSGADSPSTGVDELVDRINDEYGEWGAGCRGLVP